MHLGNLAGILVILIVFSACRFPSEYAPTSTMPPMLDPTPNLSEGDPEIGGHKISKQMSGQCLYRKPIPILYPAASGGLRNYAEEKDFWIGAAVAAPFLRGLNEYNTAAAREYNVIVPENSLKFQYVHPKPNVYDFCQMDTIVAFAQANGMRLRGHPLVWEQQLPAWVQATSMPREDWVALLQEHITQIVHRYENSVFEWDVINEPFTEEGELKDTIWQQNIGPEYIELALQWAHHASPNARLFINEFATENLNPKSDALYTLAQDLLARNIPLHGIGFQMHLLEPFPPDPDQIAANFKRFADLGLEVQVTELDVRLKEPYTHEQLERQADIYKAVFEACLSAPNCDTVVMWGVNDRSSWIPYFFESWGSPLILDDAYEPKPAYRAILEVLQP